MRVLEILQSKCLRAQLIIAQPPQSLGIILEHLVHVARRRRRRKHSLDYTIADLAELLVNLLVTLGIFRRILRNRVAGFIDILVDNDALPFEPVGMARDVIIRPDVLEAVLFKLRLKLFRKRRVDMDPDM